jgi:hypothetical protein
MKKEGRVAKNTQRQTGIDVSRRQRKIEASKPMYLLRYE